MSLGSVQIFSSLDAGTAFDPLYMRSILVGWEKTEVIDYAAGCYAEEQVIGGSELKGGN